MVGMCDTLSSRCEKRDSQARQGLAMTKPFSGNRVPAGAIDSGNQREAPRTAEKACKIHDLRSALEILEENGQLHRIEIPVDLHCELAAILVELESRGMGAALFTRPKGYAIPVVGGILSHPKRVALVLGCEPSSIADFLAKAAGRRLPPVFRDDAPFLENVHRQNADLTQIPIPQHSRKDGGGRDGRFITGGVIFARDPDTGRLNASFQRLQFKGPRRMGININNWRHLRLFYERAEARNEPLPIAIAVGVDPVVLMAAGTRTDTDELEFAGGLRGFPIEVTPAPETGIPVPTDTEIVIEGDILPHHREIEGPMAEFTGHYSGVYQCPVVEIRAISHRNNPIFETIVPASLEHQYVGNSLPKEPAVYRFAKHVSSSVRDVHVPPYGGGFLALISFKKDHPGQPKNVALAALTTHVNVKVVIVLDDDVDLYNPREVLWSLATRVDAKRDIFTIPYAQGTELDPTAENDGITTKIGIDATLPGDVRGELEKVIYERVDLSKYMVF